MADSDLPKGKEINKKEMKRTSGGLSRSRYKKRKTIVGTPLKPVAPSSDTEI